MKNRYLKQMDEAIEEMKLNLSGIPDHGRTREQSQEHDELTHALLKEEKKRNEFVAFLKTQEVTPEQEAFNALNLSKKEKVLNALLRGFKPEFEGKNKFGFHQYLFLDCKKTRTCLMKDFDGDQTVDIRMLPTVMAQDMHDKYYGLCSRWFDLQSHFGTEVIFESPYYLLGSLSVSPDANPELITFFSIDEFWNQLYVLK